MTILAEVTYWAQSLIGFALVAVDSDKAYGPCVNHNQIGSVFRSESPLFGIISVKKGWYSVEQ
jgi:hypothetical protein